MAHSIRALVFPYLLLAGIAISAVQAQVTNVTDDSSTPIPAAGHDYIGTLSETVNPANGSLSVRVQVPMPKGRALTLPFAFEYDTNGQHLVSDNGTGQMQWINNNQYLTKGGWTYSLPTVSFVLLQRAGTLNGFTVYCQYYDGYMFNDPSGSRHAMYLSGWANPTICSQLTNAPNNYLTSHDDYVRASIPTPGTVSGYLPVTVADADGTVYAFSSQSLYHVGNPVVALPATVEDRNGNLVSYTGQSNGAFTVKDTASRTAVSGSAFGVNGSTVTVSGLGNYTLSWGTVPGNSYSSGATLVPNYISCSTSWPNVSTGGSEVTNITLPNNQSYKFFYDSSTGYLNEIVYPTGGWVKYTWQRPPLSELGFTTNLSGVENACAYRYSLPVVVNRQVSYDGTTVAEQQDFTYSTAWNLGTNPPSWTSKSTSITTHDYVRGTSTFTTAYTYGSFYLFPPPNTWSRVGTQVPVESTIVYKNWDGTTLRTVNKAWYDQYELKREQTILDNGSSSQNAYTYTNGAQISEKDEYDFGASTPTRITQTSYQAFATLPTYTAGPSLFDRPSKVVVCDGTAGTGNCTSSSSYRLAETDYTYDQTVPASASVVQHDDTNYPSSYNNRGNLTTKTAKCFVGATACTDATTRYTYDETGQRLSMTDPCGNVTCSDMTGPTHTTTYSYVDRYSSGTPPGNTNAYLTLITNSLGHQNNFFYSYAPGQLTSSADANGRSTQYVYADSLRRLTETDYPDTGKVTFSYNDTAPNPTVTQTTLIDSNPLTQLSTTTTMDGFGHVVQSISTDPEGVDITDTTYDGTGHVRTASNPHRLTPSSTDGITTYEYDALGRMFKVTRPDSSTVLTTYTGRATDVMDEGNGVRRVERVSQTDALGRLVSVCEGTNLTQLGAGGTPAACGQDIAKTGFLTSYSYDTLGNLRSVTQGGVGQRTFAYNSLSQLLCAANPENASATCPNPDNGSYTAGTMRYGYDANGNVVSRLSPKPNQTSASVTVTRSYQYDVLNRTLSISYNDGTPSVANVYDQSTETGAANTIGRQTYASVSSGSTLLAKHSLVTYDAMGRLQLEYQCAPDFCAQDRYNVSYTYNQDGNEKTITAGFPGAGSQTQTNLYTSADRLQKVTTTLAQFAILDSVLYTPAGAPRSASVGPSMAQSWGYNNRNWVTSVAAAGPGPGGLQNFYTEILGYAPNGNATSVNDSVNGNLLATYDDFNRLVTAVASNVGKGCSYAYDRYGNRWQESPYGTGNSCNSRPLSFNANNHIVGYMYDAAGNELYDGAHNYTYDAESRIRSVDTNLTYVYDADGRRVAKKNGTTFTADYILDQSGRELAQLDGGGTLVRGEIYAGGRHAGTYNNQGLYFTFVDHLATERIRRNADGSALETCTNLPFGDGLTCSGTDVSALHVTGKERDTESSLDYFGARHYASTMGRFMTADQAADETIPVPLPFADFRNPQSLNLYSYGLNNPVSNVDPDGHDVHVCVDNSSGGQNCFNMSDKDYANLQQQQSEQNGINMPGGSMPGGNITCGGQVCGSATFFEPGLQDTSLDVAMFIGGVASIGRGLIEGGLGLLRGAGEAGAGTAAREAGAALAEQTVVSGGKAAIRDALENGAVNELQKQAVKRALARGAASDTYTLTKLADGSVKITTEVAGRAGGRALYEKVVDAAGQTTSVVQKAYDASGSLVHVDPKLQ